MNKKQQLSVILLGLIFWSFYLLPVLGFSNFWGTHFISFLPTPMAYALLGVTLMLILLSGKSIKWPKGTVVKTLLKPENSWKLMLILILLWLGVFGWMKVVPEIYGDSKQFISRMGESTNEFNKLYIVQLLSMNITNTKIGNTTVLSLVRLLSLVFKVSHATIFQWLGISSLIAYVVVMVKIIHRLHLTNLSKLIALTLIFFAPFGQLFLGHFEIYAPLFPALGFYFLQLKKSISKEQNHWLLLLAQLICLKLHYSSIFLLPFTLLVIWNNTQKGAPRPIHQSQFYLKYFMLPFFIVGSIVYFFIMEDHINPRYLGDDVALSERIFLPIISPEAPLDRYTLWSPYHFLDFFNVSFLWSVGASFLIVFGFLNKSERSKPNSLLMISRFVLTIYLLFFFCFNPLLSMPIDFDLFSIPGMMVLFYAILLLEQHQDGWPLKNLSLAILALSFTTVATFYVNCDKKLLSDRLVEVGKYQFKSYWIHSVQTIFDGIALAELDQQKTIEEKINIGKSLKPYAIEHQDGEYSTLMWSIGKQYRELGQYKSALTMHQTALDYDSLSNINHLGCMESAYFLNDFELAFYHSSYLFKSQYPSQKRAYEIHIECALKSGRKELAILHMKAYLKQWESNLYSSMING